MIASRTDLPFALERVAEPRGRPWSVGRSRGRLPHLETEAGTYFVTFCLADAIPAHENRRERLNREGPDAPGPEVLAEPIPTAGECVLQRPELAAVVEDALIHFNGEKYLLHAWCVMPNHVHVVVSLKPGSALSKITHSWKSYTAHRLNQCLNREGRVWQDESFDHLVRSLEKGHQFIAYTEENPVKAGLCAVPREWPFSSARRRST